MTETRSVAAEIQECTLHIDHGTARPARTVWHHIWPIGWGGPNLDYDEPGGVWTCDNGHYTVHRILDWMRKHDAPLTAVPPFVHSRKELKTAREGYQKWVAAGKPGG
jgi:hypothetical protein